MRRKEVQGRGDIYVDLQLIHIVVWQKPTHCKAIILQLKILKDLLNKIYASQTKNANSYGYQGFGLRRVYAYGRRATKVQAEGKEQDTVGVCRNASKGWRRLYLTCDLKDEQEFAEVKGRSAPDCDSRYKGPEAQAAWLQKEAEMSTAGWRYLATNGKRCGWRSQEGLGNRDLAHQGREVGLDSEGDGKVGAVSDTMNKKQRWG